MDAEAVRDLFARFGPVAVRRMFGGAGIYAEGAMFALLADGVIYLKADEQNAPAFVAEGLQRFAYAAGSGRRVRMSYWRMPDRLYDDPDELAQWAAAALAAARRAAARGAPRRVRTRASE